MHEIVGGVLEGKKLEELLPADNKLKQVSNVDTCGDKEFVNNNKPYDQTKIDAHKPIVNPERTRDIGLQQGRGQAMVRTSFGR